MYSGLDDGEIDEDELQWLVDGDEDIESASICPIESDGMEELGIVMEIRCPADSYSTEIAFTKSELIRMLNVIASNE